MSMHLQTIRRLGLALLFVVLAALALMGGPGGQVDTGELRTGTERSRFGIIERLDYAVPPLSDRS